METVQFLRKFGIMQDFGQGTPCVAAYRMGNPVPLGFGHVGIDKPQSPFNPFAKWRQPARAPANNRRAQPATGIKGQQSPNGQ